MYREAYRYLLEWKNKKDHKPLILLGARQVGKTWLMRDFAEKEFDDYLYLNFDESGNKLSSLFQGEISPENLLSIFRLKFGKAVVPGKTLLIFDEIQECPRALASLKYFREDRPDIDILAASSQISLTMHKGASFPVGQVEFLKIYPMSFTEFLKAIGKEQVAQEIQRRNWNTLSLVSDMTTDLLRKYFCVGGMPEAVKTFVNDKDMFEVRAAQQKILKSYEVDFSKHAPRNLVKRMLKIWQSLPVQIAKDNARFLYNELGLGARKNNYDMALAWLCAMDLVYPIKRVENPTFPLANYAEGDFFKAYFLDIGLLCALAEVPLETFIDSGKIFSYFSGALTGQYVLQELLSSCRSRININRWASSGTAEIDFVAQILDEVVPIEVTSTINPKAKSMKVFMDKFKPKAAVRLSLNRCGKDGILLDMPLIFANSITDAVADFLRSTRSTQQR